MPKRFQFAMDFLKDFNESFYLPEGLCLGMAALSLSRGEKHYYLRNNIEIINTNKAKDQG